MVEASSADSQAESDQLGAAADQAIAACGGDAREAVKALIIANQFLETDLEETTGCGLDGLCVGEAVRRDQDHCRVIGKIGMTEVIFMF